MIEILKDTENYCSKLLWRRILKNISDIDYLCVKLMKFGYFMWLGGVGTFNQCGVNLSTYCL